MGGALKISDYIVDFLIEKGVTDVFGYPGGMVTHLMDSLGNHEDRISTHIMYHEQAAAFAACGYAQASDKIGVAFATSGPGATNLITGIANAYFDSIPTLFITGQVNSFESKSGSAMRQKGFQETDIVTMVSDITKGAFYIDRAEKVPEILQSAFNCAMNGRKGPVLVDIPMDILRSEIDMIDCDGINEGNSFNNAKERLQFFEKMQLLLQNSNRPCIVIGNGIKTIDWQLKLFETLKEKPVPIVSSLLSVDVIQDERVEKFAYGFIGAYGNRTANFIVAKSDLVICLGSRLDIRQVGGQRAKFAPNAKIIRVDVDPAELENKIRDDDILVLLELKDAIPELIRALEMNTKSFFDWIEVCNTIKSQIGNRDECEPNRIIESISLQIPNSYNVVSDVGQHMIWVAQSFKRKSLQRMFFSGGLGSMGYALPAAIGIYYATKKPVVCFVGDGGLQMNIQELQVLFREQLPIYIFLINNEALGMIRHFQEMYFDSNYYYTVQKKGYLTPDFVKIACAYGIDAERITVNSNIREISFNNFQPKLFEIAIKGNTYVLPKLEYGKANQNQEPLLDRDLYQRLMKL